MRHVTWRSPLIAFALALVTAIAEAAEWGGIKPGDSTLETVRSRYGPPSNTKTEKTDGYDTAQWVYEEPRAPAGIQRLVVDFGLLVGGVFRPQVVRAFRLEPKPGIFTLATVLAGWGEPSRSSPVGELPRWILYENGLVVYFDKEGRQVESMLFVLPQSPTGGAGARQP